MMVFTRDEYYMHRAMLLAKEAAERGEIPVGAVIVRDGKIIASAGNGRETDRCATARAELAAIREACRVLGGWRLVGCELFVTLEPCPMCAGAIVQARIPRVVIGSMNPKAGCGGSILNILQMEQFNHRCEVTRGVLEDDCSNMLTTFFKELRQEKERKRG